jgi:hypothetical protein
MFEDDPEMQELIRKNAAEPEPEKRPLWWQIVMGVAMLLGAAATSALPIAVGWGYHPVLSATGMLGGACVVLGALGMYPGRYRIIETDERLTLWKPFKPALRALVAAGALLVPAVGIGLHLANRPDAPAAAPAPAAKVPAVKGKK